MSDAPRRHAWRVSAGARLGVASPVRGAAQSAGSRSPAAGRQGRRAGQAARRAAAAAAPVGAAAYAQRFASLCAACHGANGRSEIPGTPALAGQPGFYAITQLFLFREGRRSNEAMTAVAKTMKDDDLRGFSAVIDTLPPVPPPPPRRRPTRRA